MILSIDPQYTPQSNQSTLMKNTLFLIFMLAAALSVHAEKYALIIAIGDYPEEGKWPDISSQNDVLHVEAALLKLGFPADHIRKITDGQATKQGILDALNGLTSRVTKGDIVYIHYSGHGQQVVDQGTDEIDGLDEALVPYDSPLEFKAGIYEGINLIRDDEMGEVTANLRLRCGPTGQVILILDSCHSGTGTRGMGYVRGTDRLMAPANFTPGQKQFEKIQRSEGLTQPDMAPMASFFGASPRELNYEAKDEQSRTVGSLTYAFTTVVSQMQHAVTFEEIFDRVKQKMAAIAPRQNPQFEGPADLSFLGGTNVAQVFDFKIIGVQDENTLTGDFGTISDIFAGTTVAIYENDQKEPVNTGEVTKSNLTNCIIRLDKPMTTGKESLLKAKILEKSEPPVETTVKNLIENADSLYSAVNAAIEIPLTRGVTEAADLYVYHKDKTLKIETKEGAEIFTLKTAGLTKEQAASGVRESVRAYAQCQFLRVYENEGTNFDFSIRLNKVDCTQPEKLIRNSPDSVRLGECVQFVITNAGITGAYYSLLDIQPNDLINLIIPDVSSGKTSDEYYLEPGQSYTSPAIGISAPTGREVLKLILSRNPLQLPSIIATRGNARRGVEKMGSFENLLVSSFEVQTRGMKMKRNSNEEVGTKTVVFTITE